MRGGMTGGRSPHMESTENQNVRAQKNIYLNPFAEGSARGARLTIIDAGVGQDVGETGRGYG